MSNYGIEVKYVVSGGAAYTVFVQEMWKEGDYYYFNNPSHLYSNKRLINSEDIIFISIGFNKVLFNKGRPCSPL